MTNGDWIQVGGLIANLLVAIVAIVIASRSLSISAKATQVAADTLRDQRAAAYEEERPFPIAFLDLDRSEKRFHLVIKNLGRTSATRVRIQTTLVLPTPFQGRFLWPDEIPSIAPGQELRTYLAPAQALYGKDGWPPDFSVTISFQDHRGKTLSEQVDLSFKAFEGTPFDNTADKLIRSVESISASLKPFESSFFRGTHWTANLWGTLAESKLELVLSRSDEGYVCRVQTPARSVVASATPKGSANEKVSLEEDLRSGPAPASGDGEEQETG